MKFKITIPRREHENFEETFEDIFPDIDSAEAYAERKMNEFDDAIVEASEVKTV